MSHRLASIATLRAIEFGAKATLPDGALMARAGAAAARVIAQRLKESGHASGRIVILLGPGDNGGDGRIAAQALHRFGYDVDCLEGASFTAQLEACLGRPRPIAMIDALFGIGLSRPLEGEWLQAVDWMNRVREPILRVALDIPSGLLADTGAIIGGVAVRADLTITFLADKPGLHTGRGRELSGEVMVEDLGFSNWPIDPAPPPMSPYDGTLCCPALAHSLARPLRRGADSHKGDYGTTMIIGGSAGMTGAALLAARAALFSGAGRIVVGFPGGAPLPVDLNYPELMLRDASLALHQSGTSALAIGPGLGVDANAHELLALALERSSLDGQPLVLDADALTLIATDSALAAALDRRTQQHKDCPPILTPHPLEAARLLSTRSEAPQAPDMADSVTAARVQQNRIKAACQIARTRQCIVVLKGAGTVVASTDGRWWIVPVGNPALATGGTGDVLTGCIAGLLAQSIRKGLHPIDLALLGVWCHGRGADAWVAAGHQAQGMAAAELLPQIRAVLHDCLTPQHPKSAA